MRLEELKEKWREFPNADTPDLSNQKIREMIAMNYRNRMRKILIPELLIAAIYAYFVFFLINFSHLLDSDFLSWLGIMAITLLVLLPGTRFVLLGKLYRLGGITKSYGEAIKSFARYKYLFLFVRKAQAGIVFLILVALSILVPTIYGEAEIRYNKYFWAGIFAFGLLGIQIVNYLLLRRYRDAINEAEHLIKELKN